MAGILVSHLLDALCEKLVSASLEKLASNIVIHPDIKKLEQSLFQIRDLLADASQKEITDQSVKRWLNDLRQVAYDIDDVLDDLATEAMHRELTDESETHTNKVRKFLSNTFSKYSLWARTMKDKVNDITTRLQGLVQEKATLGLCVRMEISSKNVNRQLQTSIVHASSVVGRQAEKESLIHKLLGDEQSSQNFSIVPIVGMGGVGKTTLAKLLYDDEQVNYHFELKAWASVSDEFDSFAISEVIFQSVAGEYKKFADLNLLQLAIREHVREKRFLLVLDDVWSESCDDWETLVGPLHACAPGSKIIMTTRKDQLLKKLGYNHLNRLQSLVHEDALSLVALHALGVDNFDSHLSLKPYAVGLVEKCGSLPLALKALGRLLRTKNDEEERWKEVLDSEIWGLRVEGEIIPALKLSYQDLSAPLKQLYAYCSLFPKNHLFDKEELVQLWMAEGFLHHPTPSYSTEECLGHEYFDELLSRSFFQHAPNNESLFVMHDMMNVLATSVAGEFFIRLDIKEEHVIRNEMLEKYRHLSFVRETCVSYKKFTAFKRAKSLRTFLATSAGVTETWHNFYLSNKILVDLLPELPLLRVLCLSGFEISEVPEFIGTLIHLRYLNLSRTNITCVPENISNLYNLETLIVFGCRCLAKLPNNFLKLKKLRHLDIRDTPLLVHMPLGIGELKNLQTLSKIIVGGERGFEITELRDLKNIRGRFSVLGLEKVQNAIDAREAKFSQKKLSELEVKWSDVLNGSRNEMLEKEVLNELKPHYNYLKELKIGSYGGLEFPIWIGDPLFIRLKHVSINGCKRCASLPPVGQLSSLKELYFEGLEGVKVVGMELLGTGLAFHSLEILSFKNMGGWEKWSMNVGVVFPCLQKLHIEDCPNLVEVSLEALPSLNVLETIRGESVVLRRLLQVASSVTVLKIQSVTGLGDVVWRSVIEYLRTVEELIIWGCDELRYLWESEAAASKVLVKLRKLYVSSCNDLLSLGEKEEGDNGRSNLLASLRILLVSHCNKMERFSCTYSIEKLHVTQCRLITTISLPTGGQKLKSLYISNCYKLLESGYGGQNINNISNMSMLDYVWIKGWKNLKSITELTYSVHLTTLRIINCASLESFPDSELSKLGSLRRLQITHCPNMDGTFPRGVWPPKLHSLSIGKLKKPILNWGPQNFPSSLVDLSLMHEDGVISRSQVSHLLPSSLNSLEIIAFKELESFSMGTQHLTSLQHLGFYDCPDLMDVPEVFLPSLLSLTISHCRNLDECRKGGTYWPLISHIPCILIYPDVPSITRP